MKFLALRNLASTNWTDLNAWIKNNTHITPSNRPSWIVQYPVQAFTVAAITGISLAIIYRAIRNPRWGCRCIAGLSVITLATFAMQSLMTSVLRNHS